MTAQIAEIREQYRSLALAWAAAHANPSEANRLFKQHHAYYKMIRDTPEGRAAILSLLDDPDASVRSLAGTHALRIDPVRAEPVLEQLASGGGYTGVDAKYTLIKFRAGRLNLDW